MTFKPFLPYSPSYSEFEQVIAEGMGESSPVTDRFVRKLFAKLRSLPMNAKPIGVAETVMAKVVEDFAELYQALVTLEPPYDRATFGEVVAATKYRTLPEAARHAANKLIAETLDAIELQSVGTVGEGLFVFNYEQNAYHQAVNWKNLIELSRKTNLYAAFLNIDRELTILCASFDLVDGLILRQEAVQAV